MRFAATHKVVSYLMVTTAFLMLALTGELPPWLLLLTLAAMGGSYFFDPQQHPLMLRRSYNYSLYGAMLLLSALLLGNASGPEALWDGGLRMLCVLLVGKLWQRRHNGDYLQVYVVSFVMLLGATFVESSMLYALLLFLYVVFAMWTLTLFHLRREMEENYLLKHLPGRHGQAAESERVEVERILNSRRVVGPPFLLTTALAGLCTFFVALGLFLLLPRFHVTVELPFHRRALPSTGFSERLELGSHGLLRDNPRVVMRVELPGQNPPSVLRLRGVSFARYEQGRWSQHRLGEQPLGVSQGLAQIDAVRDLHQPPLRRTEIYLEPLDAEALFTPTPGYPVALYLPDAFAAISGLLTVTSDGQLAARGRRAPLHYAVLSSSESPSLPTDDLAIYRELSSDLRLKLRPLALQMVGDATQPSVQAERILAYLQKNYSYTTRLWKPSEREPIFEFLQRERRGHCEYFATAMAVLLRSLDIPSRTVNGYLSPEWNRYGRFFVVRQQHAHSWVEALLPGQGWVVLDPTPSQSPPAPWPILHPLRQLFDGLDMSFGKYVLEYDASAQQHLGERLLRLWQKRAASKQIDPEPPSFTYKKLLRSALLLLSSGLFAWLLYRRLKRPSDELLAGEREGRGLLVQALTVLRRRGFVRGPGETLRKLSERISDDGDPIAPHFSQLVEHYYAHRFGDQPLDRALVDRLMDQMRATPRRPRPEMRN